MIEFILLAAAIATASKIVSEGEVFAWLRNRVKGRKVGGVRAAQRLERRIRAYLYEGVTCQLCTGAWGGLIAAAFAPTFIHIGPPVAAWFADGLALAFAGRLLYSVQEVVLASSFWLERNNCKDEGYENLVKELSYKEPKERPPTLQDIDDVMASYGRPLEARDDEAPPIEYDGEPADFPPYLVDPNWEEDWRDLPDESDIYDWESERS